MQWQILKMHCTAYTHTFKTNSCRYHTDNANRHVDANRTVTQFEFRSMFANMIDCIEYDFIFFPFSASLQMCVCLYSMGLFPFHSSFNAYNERQIIFTRHKWMKRLIGGCQWSFICFSIILKVWHRCYFEINRESVQNEWWTMANRLRHYLKKSNLTGQSVSQ